MKIGCWIARSVIGLVSIRLMDVPNFLEGMASLILGNSRMTVLPCCAAASARGGSTSLVTTRRIARRDAPSVTGTRKSSSAAPVRVVATRTAGCWSQMVRHLHRTMRAERQVLTTTNRQVMLDKPPLLTVKIILFLITPDRRTNNTRPSRSRIINPSNAALRRHIHRHHTRRRCLKRRQRTPNLTTARTALLPS